MRLPPVARAAPLAAARSTRFSCCTEAGAGGCERHHIGEQDRRIARTADLGAGDLSKILQTEWPRLIEETGIRHGLLLLGFP